MKNSLFGEKETSHKNVEISVEFLKLVLILFSYYGNINIILRFELKAKILRILLIFHKYKLEHYKKLIFTEKMEPYNFSPFNTGNYFLLPCTSKLIVIKL